MFGHFKEETHWLEVSLTNKIYTDGTDRQHIHKHCQIPSKKYRIRETSNLSTDADSSTNTTVGWTKNTQKPKKN